MITNRTHNLEDIFKASRQFLFDEGYDEDDHYDSVKHSMLIKDKLIIKLIISEDEVGSKYLLIRGYDDEKDIWVSLDVEQDNSMGDFNIFDFPKPFTCQYVDTIPYDSDYLEQHPLELEDLLDPVNRCIEYLINTPTNNK